MSVKIFHLLHIAAVVVVKHVDVVIILRSLRPLCGLSRGLIIL